MILVDFSNPNPSLNIIRRMEFLLSAIVFFQSILRNNITRTPNRRNYVSV